MAGVGRFQGVVRCQLPAGWANGAAGAGIIRVSSKMYPNFANRPLNFTLPSVEVTYMEGTSVSIPDESSGVPARDDLRQRSEVRYKPERV